ncbi:hypothetical protein [Bifidobacterium sp. SO1]|uniref:hypothetical protein n=1 Tax=Bifidobacterium sp. SO1 TaxID=2809029 RepID=UPI001BDBEE0C|nr:hypothetical protein [Bifidobacterium sp. SO1]MBT1162917.1 hypothetical protein [Bifidobacterium sp. SO1]
MTLMTDDRTTADDMGDDRLLDMLRHLSDLSLADTHKVTAPMYVTGRESFKGLLPEL